MSASEARVAMVLVNGVISQGASNLQFRGRKEFQIFNSNWVDSGQP